MTSMNRFLSAFALLVCSLPLVSAAASEAAIQTTERPISGSYIVVLEADAGSQSIGAPRSTQQVASDLAGFYGGSSARVYQSALQGFHFRGSSAAAENLSRDPRVAYVAQDGLVTIASVQTPTPSWGLDRIDQRAIELNSEYVYYNDGEGVDLYVVDTGIRSTHDDFGGRVDTVNSFTAIDDGRGAEDCNGHGTLVAGVAGGSTFGVAKGVTLHSVRVVGCDGMVSLENTLAGIDWITERQGQVGARRAVVNISLYNGFSFPLEAAVETSIAAGVVYVVAAGNDGLDSPCYISPQRLPAVITVGASDETGARWPMSNYGSCLDLFAPGTGIASTSSVGDSEFGAMTGTSVASPHVAGTAALVLAVHPDLSPEAVQAAIVAAATADTLADTGEGSPNLLLYSAFEGSGPGIFTDGFEAGDPSLWSTFLP